MPDPVMAKLMQYTSHAQVLRDHPAFDFCAVVDSALPLSSKRKVDYPEIAIASSCAELTNGDDIQVLVLATPPIIDFATSRSLTISRQS